MIFMLLDFRPVKRVLVHDGVLAVKGLPRVYSVFSESKDGSSIELRIDNSVKRVNYSDLEKLYAQDKLDLLYN